MKPGGTSSINAAELYPIRTVANLTGVNPITLRAWERRYGLIKPVRTDSGHRMYRREDIDLIHRVRAQLDKGIPISRVGAALGVQPESGECAVPSGHPQFDALRDRLIAAVTRFDEQAVDDAYNEALALAPIGEVTQRLLLPLLCDLGTRWETHEGSVAEEHFFSVYLRNKIGARFHHRPRGIPRVGEPFLAACLPGELHEVGLLLFAFAAHEEGLTPILLGADTPLDELPLAARRARCAAIVLAGLIAPAPEVLRRELPRLVARADIPVAVGGQVSIDFHGALIAAGAQPLGADLAHGVARLRELLVTKPHE